MHHYFLHTLKEASGSVAIFKRVFSTDFDDSELERIEYLRELAGQVHDPPVQEKAEDPNAPELRLLELQQPPRPTRGGGFVRRLDGVDRSRGRGGARRASRGRDGERESRCVTARLGDRGAEQSMRVWRRLPIMERISGGRSDQGRFTVPSMRDPALAIADVAGRRRGRNRRCQN
ncbi:hypothetical protein ACJRO7_005427 [Eucalyptus globulus]|uniref:Uncharacterized protein n=1 Tax=Eucalyptus globulus TaxID=34317 RepID=A0ABD3J4B3_EUCGL